MGVGCSYGGLFDLVLVWLGFGRVVVCVVVFVYFGLLDCNVVVGGMVVVWIFNFFFYFFL